jgi:hypothetical protein
MALYSLDLFLFEAELLDVKYVFSC